MSSASSLRLCQQLARRLASRAVAAAHQQQQRRTIAEMRQRVTKKGDLPKPVQQYLEDLPEVPWTHDIAKINPLVSDTAKCVYNQAVTAAHWVEHGASEISTLDSVAVSPDGQVVHGRYGNLRERYPNVDSIPLEFLALLRPAAEGAAALRLLTEKQPGQKGTILLYGASSAQGMALLQMADKAGHAIAAVVTSNHAGNDNMLFCVKHLMQEPSFAVCEEMAIQKRTFRELVHGISTGDEGYEKTKDPKAYLADFKRLFKDYSEAFPDTRVAAVPEDAMDFDGMEQDREHWEANMGTYLKENFPPGAPPVDAAKLDKFFDEKQYEIWRQGFWHQTSLVAAYAGDFGGDFLPAHRVHDQIASSKDEALAMQYAEAPYVFSLYNNVEAAPGARAGGPVLGAVIVVTPELKIAAEAVHKAGPSLRAKAEALVFLTNDQRKTYLAACSVVAQAAGKPVIVLGDDLPERKATVADEKQDVLTALKGLDLKEDGSEADVNWFVQLYRANDYPFYADFAVHKAQEACAGPRQLVVLK